MGTYRDWSRFVLRRGLLLCALLLVGTVYLLLRAREGGGMAVQYRACADAMERAAQAAFGCGLIGSILVEDVLRYFGE